MNFILWDKGTEQGPYDLATVQNSIQQGTLSPKVLARLSTATDWKPLEQILPKAEQPTRTANHNEKTSPGSRASKLRKVCIYGCCILGLLAVAAAFQFIKSGTVLGFGTPRLKNLKGTAFVLTQDLEPLRFKFMSVSLLAEDATLQHIEGKEAELAELRKVYEAERQKLRTDTDTAKQLLNANVATLRKITNSRIARREAGDCILKVLKVRKHQNVSDAFHELSETVREYVRGKPDDEERKRVAKANEIFTAQEEMALQQISSEARMYLKDATISEESANIQFEAEADLARLEQRTKLALSEGQQLVAKCERAEAEILSWPRRYAAAVFQDLPAPLSATRTDEEGRFLLKVPSKGNFVVAATAKLEADNRTESYYWLVRVSLERHEEGFLPLSSDNLLYVNNTESIVSVPE